MTAVSAIVMSVSGIGVTAQEWVARYNGPADSTDELRAMAVDDSGCVYVTGRSLGVTGLTDYATVALSPSGDTMWCMSSDQVYRSPIEVE